MRAKIIFSLFMAVFCLAVSFDTVGQEMGNAMSINDFASSPVGKFPPKWRTWPFERGKASQVYGIEKEGSSFFLRAVDDKDLSEQIMRYFYWPIKKYPTLSWKWRAKTLPKDAAENDDLKNDSACGVYIIFGRLSGHAIKYVWSTGLPVGDVVARRDGKLKIKVLESGEKHLNKWRSNTVNIPDDYAMVFGKELSKDPSGIALLTDGNATHSRAACDYKDFFISEEGTK